MHAKVRPSLTPQALKDAPALIESVFPAQKISIEAQSERKAVASQTLTGLGSYWKGRKPLILVRAIVLGNLLPRTPNPKEDLEVFEQLLAIDDEGLARRALAENGIKPKEIARSITLSNPLEYFRAQSVSETQDGAAETYEVHDLRFPVDCEAQGITLRWRSDVNEGQKLALYRRTLAGISSYEQKAALGKRPEEVPESWLYEPVWPRVNEYYAHLGINAQSTRELVEQLGILRYGHRPVVGDTFSGAGSIPFEAARVGCEVYAADLNPVACMLSWGALNIAGLPSERREFLEEEQRRVAAAAAEEIATLGIERDEEGNQAKAFLYCLETRCPQTGWMVPLSPSWVISKSRRAVAQLVPDPSNKRFHIEVKTGVTAEAMRMAEAGTVQDGDLVYELDGTVHRTPIKTIRGEYRAADGSSANRLRRWEKTDFKPREEDVFQERLYAIQWVRKASIGKSQQDTFFATVTASDLNRELEIETLLKRNIVRWQESGVLPDMAIETGKENEGPIRTNGWTYWHHMFTPRALFYLSLLTQQRSLRFEQLLPFMISKFADNNSKSCRWAVSQSGGDGGAKSTFDNPSLKTIFNWANRAFAVTPFKVSAARFGNLQSRVTVRNNDARGTSQSCDMFITDPPYADAVNYHEITEFFIAWIRQNAPAPFNDWIWDSRRALAIRGAGDEFRSGMIESYRAMTKRMPDNGIQCVMFTHQDTGVWGDLIGIFWAAGLQVVAAWYIATETTSELKKGGYVQGTVILILKKRAAGEHVGFKQRILPAVRQEVQRQIETMMHLNDTVKEHHGEPVFNDSDLQMAGYAAALKVLTAYTQIGGEDVTSFALRPRVRGEVTVVDEIVQQAAETASSLLVPEGLAADTWTRLTGIERFVLRMLDMETTGAAKLDNYQNFAKAFHVEDYTRVMSDMRPNQARLKRVTEFVSRDLTESTELGASRLGRVIVALQQLLKDTEPQVIVGQLQAEMPDFLEVRGMLADILTFLEHKVPEPDVRARAEVLAARLKNLRLGA